ncbi:hypothetical protein HYY72_00810 [Candidatus Woesearchaeota archaeon]|nr:hypothetical protein [Candidatus Woesearchaeota archaeon]
MAEEDSDSDELELSNPNRELQDSIDKLNRTVESLISLFKTASADIHSEADSDMGRKLDTLIKQNEDIARAMLMLLEINKEHLPKISRQAERNSRRAYIAPTAPVQRIEPVVSLPRPSPNSPSNAYGKYNAPVQQSAFNPPQPPKMPVQAGSREEPETIVLPELPSTLAKKGLYPHP